MRRKVKTDVDLLSDPADFQPPDAPADNQQCLSMFLVRLFS
jgi:hypothetical protein